MYTLKHFETHEISVLFLKYLFLLIIRFTFLMFIISSLHSAYGCILLACVTLCVARQLFIINVEDNIMELLKMCACPTVELVSMASKNFPGI